MMEITSLREKDSRLRLKRDEVVVEDAVHDVLSLLQGSTDKHGRPLLKASVRVVVETTKCPMIVADARRLQQVLFNLIDNALKFTGKGSVRVATYMEQGSGEKLLHVTSIKDTGIGITKEALQRIFEPFEQEDASDTRQFGGLGLGLAISREVVEAHGGRIEVDSEPGQGSEFRVMLPVDGLPGDMENEGHDTPGKSASGGNSASSILTPSVRDVLAKPGEFSKRRATESDLQKKRTPFARGDKIRILIVDDELVNHEVMRAALEGEPDMLLENAVSGMEALDLLAQAHDSPTPFDIVLLDLMMPVMSGFDVLVKLRKDARYTDLAIVVVSAKMQKEVVSEALSKGADDFITKPFALDSFARRVREFKRIATNGEGPRGPNSPSYVSQTSAPRDCVDMPAAQSRTPPAPEFGDSLMRLVARPPPKAKEEDSPPRERRKERKERTRDRDVEQKIDARAQEHRDQKSKGLAPWTPRVGEHIEKVQEQTIEGCLLYVALQRTERPWSLAACAGALAKLEARLQLSAAAVVRLADGALVAVAGTSGSEVRRALLACVEQVDQGLDGLSLQYSLQHGVVTTGSAGGSHLILGDPVVAGRRAVHARAGPGSLQSGRAGSGSPTSLHASDVSPAPSAKAAAVLELRETQVEQLEKEVFMFRRKCRALEEQLFDLSPAAAASPTKDERPGPDRPRPDRPEPGNGHGSSWAAAKTTGRPPPARGAKSALKRPPPHDLPARAAPVTPLTPSVGGQTPVPATPMPGSQTPITPVTPGSSMLPVVDGWEVEAVLGEGTSSKVFRATCLKDGQRYALKMRKRAGAEEETQVKAEYDILKGLSHDSIVAVNSYFVQYHAFLVMEYLPSVPLSEVITRSRVGLPETSARVLTKQLVNAVFYLHQREIAHRDIKPDNLLVLKDTSDREVNLLDAQLVLIDFNTAQFHNNMMTMTGTVAFMAPEMLSGWAYDERVDVWAIGITTFMMLTNALPADAGGDNPLPRLGEDRLAALSAPPRSFIEMTLVMDKRPSATACLTHMWLHQR